MQFPERDWKTLSRLKPLALDRLCRRILDEARAIIAGAAEGEHHRVYLKLYRHIQEQNRLIADGFDYWSRSRALEHLLIWHRYGLITGGTRDFKPGDPGHSGAAALVDDVMGGISTRERDRGGLLGFGNR